MMTEHERSWTVRMTCDKDDKLKKYTDRVETTNPWNDTHVVLLIYERTRSKEV